MSTRKKAFLIILLIFASIYAYPQTGFIRGTVYDNTSGESLPGVTVIVVGTSIGVMSDFDGNFNLSTAPGIYTLRVSFVSYEAVVIDSIVVKSGEATVFENIRLKESRLDLAEVVVSADQIRNTEVALNTIKMRSISLLDGISAVGLKRTGDSDAASSMKRVTGVSVDGGRYVYVRGLGDRYTKTMLNGVDVPGLDPDRNTLQMDIFPSSIIDNLIVHKSFNADLPADFTGGVIDIELKSFPLEEQGSISFSAAYNPVSHFNSEFLTYEGGKTDFLGFDDGTRAIPASTNIPFYTEAISDPNGVSGLRYKEILESFNPSMAAMKAQSFMDYGFGLSYGNQKPLEKITLGYNLSLTYKNNTEFYENAIYGRYGLSDPDIYEMEQRDQTIGNYGVSSTFWSGLAGFAVKTRNTKLRINIVHLQNGESKAGIFDYNSTDVGTIFNGFQHTLEYSERSVTNLLIDGKHSFNKAKLDVVWKFSPTISKIEDPDIRFTRYVDRGSTWDIGTESGFPERIWRNLEETNLGGVVHFTKDIDINGKELKLRFGGGYTYKDRDFSIKGFAINVRNIPLTGDPNELFQPENLWPYQDNVGRGTTYEADFYPFNPNKYNSSTTNIASYLSAEFSILKQLKSVVGVRYEDYSQKYTGQNQLRTIVYNNEEVLKNRDFFPSINLIYSITDRQNLRFSYSQTIARPSFKELSFAEVYDPISGRTFIGSLFEDIDQNKGTVYWDGKLTSTAIQNYDLRWERFELGGQMVSISAFYKNFNNPIEMVQYSTTQKTSIQPRNVGNGKVLGLEFELKQSLDLFAKTLENFHLTANYTVVRSRIEMSQTEYESRVSSARDGQTIEKYRDMAGQAPYILNTGISYYGSEKGIWNGMEAGLFYNVQGSSLQVVGISDRPDVYVKPFHSLNLNINKGFGPSKKVQLGVRVENILNDTRESVYTSFKAADQLYTSLFQGMTYHFRLSLNL